MKPYAPINVKPAEGGRQGITPLRNEFPELWEFLGIPIYSKTCKWAKIKNLGIFVNIWERLKIPVGIFGNS